MVLDRANMEDDPKAGTHSCARHIGLQSGSIVLMQCDSFFQSSWPIYPDRLLQLSQQVSIVLSIHGLAFFQTVMKTMTLASQKLEAVNYSADETTLAFFGRGKKGHVHCTDRLSVSNSRW